MKQLVAYLFVIIFLFSSAPVREVGKLLSKAQTTEDVHNDGGCDCNDTDGKIKGDLDPFILHEFSAEISSSACYYDHKVQVAIHAASILPDHFTPKIPTPPPDAQHAA